MRKKGPGSCPPLTRSLFQGPHHSGPPSQYILGPPTAEWLHGTARHPGSGLFEGRPRGPLSALSLPLFALDLPEPFPAFAFFQWLPTASGTESKCPSLSLEASLPWCRLLLPASPPISLTHLCSLWLLHTCAFPASRAVLRLCPLLRMPFIPFLVCQKSYVAKYPFSNSPG